MTAMFFPGSLIVANLVTVIGARQGSAFRVKRSLQGLDPMLRREGLVVQP